MKDDRVLRIIGMVPARSRSKGLPEKNIQSLYKKPMLAYSILAAKECTLIDEVYLNSDSDHYLEVGTHYGAIPYLRGLEHSRDDSTMLSVVLDFVHTVKSNGTSVDAVVVLYPTYPQRTAKDIDQFLRVFLKSGAERPLIGFKMPKTSPNLCYSLYPDKRVKQAMEFDVDKLYRRQDYPIYYELCHWACVLPTANLDQLNSQLISEDTFGYVIPSDRPVIDVDTIEDFRRVESEMAETKKGNLYNTTENYISELENIELSQLPQSISALIFDFDGVFTNNKVIVFEDGREAVICDRADGLGLEEAKKNNLKMMILSSEKNKVVSARCKKLGIECIQGSKDKLRDLEIWAEKSAIDLQKIIYVGNDNNDIPCLMAVGCGIAVNNSSESVKSIASIVLQSSGGDGAVREILDLLKKRETRFQ